MYLAIMCHYHNEQYLHVSSMEGWAYQTMVRIGYNENNQYVIFITILYYLVHVIVSQISTLIAYPVIYFWQTKWCHIFRWNYIDIVLYCGYRTILWVLWSLVIAWMNIVYYMLYERVRDTTSKYINKNWIKDKSEAFRQMSKNYFIMFLFITYFSRKTLDLIVLPGNINSFKHFRWKENRKST